MPDKKSNSSKQPTPTKAGVAFAKRLTEACDNNPRVPPLNKGRYTWIEREIKDYDPTAFRGSRSIESIRKWFAGLTMPRDKTLRALAHVIGQTPSWLLIGDTGALPVKEQRVRNAAADGAVNVLTGFLQMNGASPAFPDLSMQEDLDHHVDVLAVIKGGMYRFSVVMGQKNGEGWLFAIPLAAVSENIKIIGVVPVSDLVCDFIYLDHEILLERGKRSKTGTLDVTTDEAYQADDFAWPRIESFRSGFVG